MSCAELAALTLSCTSILQSRRVGHPGDVSTSEGRRGDVSTRELHIGANVERSVSVRNPTPPIVVSTQGLLPLPPSLLTSLCVARAQGARALFAGSVVSCTA